jgi:hypothetical protein
MPYDEQGNFYGSNEDLGALEAKYTKPDLASQIPGQVTSSKSEEPKSLREKAVSAFMQYNPLMMAKSFQDMTKTLVGGAALPVVAPISAGVQALNAAPGNMLRRSRGEEEVKTPSADDLMRKYGEAIAPQTEAGRNFQEGVGKLMETLKVPHAWPLTPAGPRRPMLTPTDVRVGAGQVKQLAKELRETPADFQAAQSGLKRQNLYGEDTIGVKAQAAADALGDTLERRQAAGKSVLPGIPQALTPETKLYAVRPKGTRMVQPKVPKSAGAYRPDVSPLEGIVEDVYGDTPAAQMPPEMVSAEYAKRFLTPDSELSGAFKNYMTLRVQEMFPDAPTPRAAQNAYDLLYANRSERTKQQMVELEEFLTNVVPEYRESAPTPTEFMQRMAEAERVIKGPFTTYLSKNVGAEGDPTVKLARQGITLETPEDIQHLAQFASPTELAKKRLEAGFPAMGSFYEERLAKTSELDRINAEIDEIEQVRQPLFDRAHAEGIDPASIPEYAETTNPLRQKLRQKELLQGEIENIKLAQDVENISDYAVEPKTKQEMLERIPFEQRQFYPGVTKAGEGEKLYMGRESLLKDLGFKKLGKDLLEDILTGKAGDTSKLTIENYMREKGLSRIEAEKAAKLQEQKYRETLQNTLLERIRNDQNVKTFGNAAIITLDKNTPKDVAMRDMSADTAILDHCVGQCGTAPQGRKNILTGQQQYYEPVIDPITGERHARGTLDTSYVNDLQRGGELVSVRDVKTGLPAATIQLSPAGRGKYDQGQFNIGFASGAKNKSVDPAYVNAIKDYLNSRSDAINSSGPNLADNTGIFDTRAPGEWRRVTKEAGLSKDQATVFEAEMDIPRFVTVKDIKEMSGEYLTIEQPSESRSVAVALREEPIPIMSPTDLLEQYGDRLTTEQQNWLRNHNRVFIEADATPGRQTELAGEYANWRDENRLQAQRVPQGDPMPDNLDVTDLIRAHGDRMTPEQLNWLQNFTQRWDNDVDGSPAGQGIEAQMIEEYDRWLSNNRLQPDPLANLFDDLEPDPTAVANQPAQPQNQIAVRTPVPRELQTMAITDLTNSMSPTSNRQAQELADLYFRENIIDADNTSIGALTNMIRNYAVGPHEQAQFIVRELAARRLESLNTASRQDANQIAETLQEAFYDDTEGPEQSLRDVERDISILERSGETAWEDIIGPLAEDIPWNRNTQNRLVERLQTLADVYRRQIDEGDGEGGLPADTPPRRGPFQPGGASAVRGVPLGNLNIQPAIRADALRGPDTQPIRNFLQQVKALPGVTQEGLATGLMAFRNMDPTTRMTKAQFVRELLPSSYDVVDLKNAATDNQHIRELVEEDFIDDQSPVGYLLGLTDGQVDMWSEALAEHGTDFDLYPAKLKRALAKKGIKDSDQYNKAYDDAYQAAIQQGIDDYRNYNMEGENEDGYMYASTQRLVETNMGDQYGEFGVVHPDQRGSYTHYDEAPEGTMGHFRGTYNPADPMELSTFGTTLPPERIKQLDKEFKKAFGSDLLTDNNRVRNLKKLISKPDFTPGDAHYLDYYIQKNLDEDFEWTSDEIVDKMQKIARDKVKESSVETKPGSYVIEEIQSDAQKGTQQKGHLHQVHGILFKAAVQKGLELGADTIYLPTGEVIAKARNEKTANFAPIYDQAIVKEGLKPLLKIPGVTSKMFNGYHEISFTPEAKEYILNGPGQTIPGYAKGGLVKKPTMALVVTRKNPELAEMTYRYGGMVR